MSRAAKTDHSPDILVFTKLLNEARGLRTQTEFANDCGVSVAYLCKYLNMKYEKAPTPTTIKKIAASAANNVSLSNLLMAAGYDPAKYVFDQTENNSNNRERKLAISSISLLLADCDFKWTSVSRKLSSFFDFTIDIIDGDISRWSFCYFENNSFDSASVSFRNRIMSHYSNFFFEKNESPTKFSLVTNNKDTFQALINFKPYMLAAFVSIILVDTNNLIILQEQNLETALITNDSVQIEKYKLS